MQADNLEEVQNQVEVFSIFYHGECCVIVLDHNLQGDANLCQLILHYCCNFTIYLICIRKQCEFTSVCVSGFLQ